MSIAEPRRAAARRLFGTDGARGLANTEPVTPETALRLGRAVAHLCVRRDARRPTIVIGKDTRISGDMVEHALAAGVCSMGVDAVLTGPLPTPGIAFLTRAVGASFGAVISASHNPFADNGIKFFAADGFKLPDASEEELERLVLGSDIDHQRPTGAAIGRVRRLEDAAARYTAFLVGLLPSGLRFHRFKVVLDCAHGAAYGVAPACAASLGASVTAIGVEPDGENINDGYGAMHPERLQEAVRAAGAHLGIAFDGDADRALFVDETGALVDGDEVLAMLAADMLVRGTLKQQTVVATVMSNIGLDVALRAHHARLVRVQVGDRYVVEEMRRGGYNLGGEQSGHLIFLDATTTGDGLVAALSVLRLMAEQQLPLSELKRVMTKFPQVLLNVPVERRQDLNELPALQQAIERISGVLGARGRVLVRYSGTEPLVRVMVEGEDAARVRAYAEEIAAAVRSVLPVREKEAP